jgi:hypothetical protein
MTDQIKSTALRALNSLPPWVFIGGLFLLVLGVYLLDRSDVMIQQFVRDLFTATLTASGMNALKQLAPDPPKPLGLASLPVKKSVEA